MGTPESEQMASIVSGFSALMKQHGFRRRRHCFNRSTEGGLVHVVNFWQHPKEPPAWTEVAGLRERHYCTFRVDFGVYVPEMTRGGSPRSTWVNGVDCHLRRTAGQLEGLTSDRWLHLGDPESVELTDRSIRCFGLPWLERFATRQAVVHEFLAQGGLAIGMTPAGGLDVADMLLELGRLSDARSVLENYVSGTVLESHAQYLGDFLRDRGHPDLVSRIKTHRPTSL